MVVQPGNLIALKQRWWHPVLMSCTICLILFFEDQPYDLPNLELPKLPVQFHVTPDSPPLGFPSTESEDCPKAKKRRKSDAPVDKSDNKPCKLVLFFASETNIHT
jgi:hypothetical protein